MLKHIAIMWPSICTLNFPSILYSTFLVRFRISSVTRHSGHTSSTTKCSPPISHPRILYVEASRYPSTCRWNALFTRNYSLAVVSDGEVVHAIIANVSMRRSFLTQLISDRSSNPMKPDFLQHKPSLSMCLYRSPLQISIITPYTHYLKSNTFLTFIYIHDLS